MKTSKNNGKQMGYVLALGLVTMAGVRAADPVTPSTVVQNFTYTTAFEASPLAALPTIDKTWNIQSYAGLPQELVAVKLEITTQVRYLGTLISLVESKEYTVQVRSDFNLDFGGGATPNHPELDPVVILGGTSPGTALTPFDVTDTKSANATELLETTPGLDQYRSGSPVTVFVTGNLKTDALSGFHNTSDQGSASPAAFVDSLKVLPVFGAQLYELQTTLQVTYFVPESPAPVAALGALALGWYFLRRRAKLRG